VTTLLSLYLIALTAFIFGLMIYQHVRATHPLLSVRNFALLGLVVFQSGSGALHLWTKDYDVYPIGNPGRTGAIFCVWLTIFLALFLLSYRIGIPAKNLAKLLPRTRSRPTSASLLMMAVVFTMVATALKLLETATAALGIISALGLVVGCGAMACGLVGWVWGRNFLNPVIMSITGAIFLFNGAVSMIGGFGRRPLVAFGAALLWGLFYSKLRYMRPAAMLRWLAFASIPPIMVVAAFTAARSSGERDRTIPEQIRAMVSGDLSLGVQLLAGGQSTGPAAMFVIERYPETYQGTFLHSFWMVFLHPVPRAIWPDKPVPISTKIAAQANVQGVAVDQLTLPPGIVGYAAAEGGWIALFVYGVFFGLFMRFFDELVALNPYAPMVVLPVGTQLGQILGIFRGEPSLFGATYWMTVLILYVALVALSKLFEGRFVDTMPSEELYDPATWSYGDQAAESYEIER
jgi:hypothetical protein